MKYFEQITDYFGGQSVADERLQVVSVLWQNLQRLQHNQNSVDTRTTQILKQQTVNNRVHSHTGNHGDHPAPLPW